MAIEVKIKKQLGNFCLDVDFTAGNEVLALLGGSGCGKSMTLRCIAGIERPDEGKIIIDGVTVFDSAKKINLSPQERQIGLLFQSYALFPSMTVWENIACGIREKKTKAEQKAMIEDSIRRFHLDGLEKHLPSQLSGGQKQRAALARMLIGTPKLLMLDEPFSALDSYLRWELERELVKTLSEYDGSVLFVSHDRDEVYRISDRVAVYNKGKIDILADKWELFRHPETTTAAVLTGCKNVAPAVYENGNVTCSAFGLTLPASGADEKDTHIGIRARKIRPATVPGNRVYSYTIVEEIDGAFTDILMISLPGATSLLRWEVLKSVRDEIRSGPALVEFPEDAVLFLHE